MGNPIFDTIAQEIERGEIDKGLWTEAFAAANGNENATKARYIQLRARQFTCRAERSLSGHGFGTALMWCLAVGFCGVAASSLCGAVIWTARQRFDMLLILAAFAALPALGARTLFRHVVARLTAQQPTRAYWILEIAAVASLGLTFDAYFNSKGPDPVPNLAAGLIIVFAPYGFMALSRAKQLRRAKGEVIGGNSFWSWR